ncbi:MAG: thermonuclease family protein [Methylococcaceae bacterium]|nr:thermonuclease family protein [Methylococcaceae bacterium]
MKKSLAIFLMLTSAVASFGASEIYVREEPGGQRHYSDKPSPNAKRLAIRAGAGYRVVQAVFDGDTLLLDDRSKVRLSGINTPEVETPRKSAESGGDEARMWLKNILEGKKVRLDGDVDRTDHYKRMLAHVFTEDGTHINRVLVRSGLATVNIYPPNLKYAEQLLEAQRLAETEGLGIWGDPAYTPRPVASLPGSKGKGWRRLIGRPLALKPNRKFYRLIYSEQVDVRIPRANLDLFPDLKSYLGRDTEIRGWPSRRKDHYSILVRHPSALRLVGKA